MDAKRTPSLGHAHSRRGRLANPVFRDFRAAGGRGGAGRGGAAAKALIGQGEARSRRRRRPLTRVWSSARGLVPSGGGSLTAAGVRPRDSETRGPGIPLGWHSAVSLLSCSAASSPPSRSGGWDRALAGDRAQRPAQAPRLLVPLPARLRGEDSYSGAVRLE